MFLTNQNAEIVACILLYMKIRIYANDYIMSVGDERHY